MFDLLSTLIKGANAKATETATDYFAIDLLNQKIREAEAGVTGAKQALATLIMRQRNEQRALDLREDEEDRPRRAGCATPSLRGTRSSRWKGQLPSPISRTKKTCASGLWCASRRKCGGFAFRSRRPIAGLSTSARAPSLPEPSTSSGDSQKQVVRSINGGSAIEEAEALIRRVADQDDPLEHAEIADEIDASLSHKATEDRLAAAGFGPQTKVRPEDVLARLKTAPTAPAA